MGATQRNRRPAPVVACRDAEPSGTQPGDLRGMFARQVQLAIEDLDGALVELEGEMIHPASFRAALLKGLVRDLAGMARRLRTQTDVLRQADREARRGLLVLKGPGP